MDYEINKLIYLEEEKGYFIPCCILEVGLDLTRITLSHPDKPLLRHTYELQKIYSGEVIKSKKYIDDGFESLLRVDTISYSLHELVYGHKILNYKIKADIIELKCTNIQNIIVKYKNAQEYFNIRTNRELGIEGYLVPKIDLNEDSIKIQQKLVNTFNKGSFDIKKGEPLFSVISESKENYTLDEIADKVATIASKKLNTNNSQKDISNKVLIEFYGGPGSGKSLHAYSLSNYLKLNLQNKVVEFSKEQAQEMYWEGRVNSMSNMLKVLGRQMENYDIRFEGGADIVVADTSLDLAAYYDKFVSLPLVKNIILEDVHLAYPFRIKIFCDRQGDEKSYTTTGRLQSFETSKQIDRSLKHLFQPFDVKTSEENWQEKVLTLAQKMIYNE